METDSKPGEPVATAVTDDWGYTLVGVAHDANLS